MMLVAAVVASALAGTGIVLAVRGAVGQTTPLASLVTELHRPRAEQARSTTGRGLIGVVAGRSTRRLQMDLAVCERDVDRWIRDRLLWATLGAAPGGLLFLLGVAGGQRWLTPAIAIVVGLAGTSAGWLYARQDLASDAERARREFRHSLASYLELVTILMAGGAGVETAMFDAVAIGRGGPFRHLRASLSAAQARREAPWKALGELGARTGVIELEELEASMTLAGGGAQVRDSLTAKARAMRTKDLAALEAEAQAQSETMVLPVALMFAAFLLLIGYPALAALSTT